MYRMNQQQKPKKHTMAELAVLNQRRDEMAGISPARRAELNAAEKARCDSNTQIKMAYLQGRIKKSE